MGYYTEYELHVDDCEKYVKEIELIAGYSGLFSCELKWYSHERNMREHSLKYPDTVFRLDGKGEESGDIWVKYFKNGKMQETKAKLMFDKFNEDLLE